MAAIARTPLLLRGVVLTQGNSPGGLIDSLMLVNTSREPVMIEGLRIRPLTTTGVVLLRVAEVEARVGASPITNGFLPLPILGSPLDRLAAVEGYWTWRFPEAMLLRPQERVVLRFRVLGTTITEQIAVDAVGYVADAPQALGRVREVPYATAYSAGPIPSDTAAFRVESKEPDLGNPFAVPLFVERLAASVILSSYPQDGRLQTDLLAVPRALTLRVVDARGNVVFRSPTPFTSAFDPLRTSWFVRTWAPARHFFLATLEGSFAGSDVKNVYPSVGLVGTRKERI